MARTERVEVRLDEHSRRKLEEELVRGRLEAAQRLFELEFEEVPEVETLKRQLEGTYEQDIH